MIQVTYSAIDPWLEAQNVAHGCDCRYLAGSRGTFEGWLQEVVAIRVSAASYLQGLSFHDSRYCPVESTRLRLLTKQSMGQFPVVSSDFIFFVYDEANRKEFMTNVNKFISQPPPLEPNFPRICIVGPPKSGKTTLAQRLALQYDLEYVTVAKAVAYVMENCEKSELCAHVRLQRMDQQYFDSLFRSFQIYEAASRYLKIFVHPHWKFCLAALFAFPRGIPVIFRWTVTHIF